MRFVRGFGWPVGLALATLLLTSSPCFSAVQIRYSTGFETNEGYRSDIDLEGQLDWLGTTPAVTNDNGLISGFFLDLGQHAYIGYRGTTNDDGSVFLWHPATLAPIPPARPIVRFSVVMAIVDSSTNNRDQFLWSVFNANGDQLFLLGFDNADLSIKYYLEDGDDFVPTGFNFENNVRYHLEVVMDFAINRWSAMLNDTTVATNLPITQLGSDLNFGDVDAVWYYKDFLQPGDNYMVFDDYRITSESAPSTPRPRLTDPVRLTNGDFLLRVTGEAGRKYAVEASIDLLNWSALSTNTADNGFFEFRDRTAAGLAKRFYRARLVP